MLKKLLRLCPPGIKRLVLPLICGVLLTGCASSPPRSVPASAVQERLITLPEAVTASDSGTVSDYSERVRLYSEKVRNWLERARLYLLDSRQTRTR
nr:MAG TPA_asm: Type IV secretion system apparatus, Secretion, H [Bacteriophage sp.]